MRGNSHVQFLMGKAAVTPLTYITKKESGFVPMRVVSTCITAKPTALKILIWNTSDWEVIQCMVLVNFLPIAFYLLLTTDSAYSTSPPDDLKTIITKMGFHCRLLTNMHFIKLAMVKFL